MLATQNPIEQEGTYPLPEAQLDRFMFNVVIGYPTAVDERAILAQTTTGDQRPVTPVADGATRSKRARVLVRDIVGGRQRRRLCRAARARDAGRPETSGPRAGLRSAVGAMGRRPARRPVAAAGGKARAVLHGRRRVSLEDIRAVAPPVLRHRILVNFQAEADGVDAEQVVSRLLDARCSPTVAACPARTSSRPQNCSRCATWS